MRTRRGFWGFCSTCVGFIGALAAALMMPGPLFGSDLQANQLETHGILSQNIPNPPVPAGGWHRQVFDVANSNDRPVIDGLINESCWKEATHAFGFYRQGGSSAISQQTEAWILADKTALYIAFHCVDREPQRISAKETQRNGDFSHDDYVTVGIDSQNERRGVSFFAVNARGTQAQQIEGGTADNITWAGDWRAAAQRTVDGWSVEIEIPFRLLRYPRGAHSFGLLLGRQLARETSSEVWPFVPAADDLRPYYQEFRGIAPSGAGPRPTFLQYVLTSVGAHENNTPASTTGIDIKYPVTPAMTALLTLRPDFQTIEQDIADVDFSYTEKFVTDRRPFFAEGTDFLPPVEQFYSPRFGQIDSGVKLAGKEGPTTIGLVGLSYAGAPEGQAYAVNLKRDIGLYNSIGLSMVGDQPAEGPGNRVVRLAGQYGWRASQYLYSCGAQHMQSQSGGASAGGMDTADIAVTPPRGRLGFGVHFKDIGPNFTSNLGYVPQLDERGASYVVSQQNQFDTGAIESYDASVEYDAYDHHLGGQFLRSTNVSLDMATRNGIGLGWTGVGSTRDQHYDHIQAKTFSWGRKTLFQRGSVSRSLGTIGGRTYDYLSMSQGLLTTRLINVQIDYGRLKLGDLRDTQTVVTGLYRINSSRTLGWRLLKQDNSVNYFVSFSQKARSGADIYILYGDPNSTSLVNRLALKVVYPW